MIQYQIKPATLTTPKIVPVVLSIAGRMAEDMREMAFAGENVNVETLKMRGYTEPVIKRVAPRAALIARRRSVRQIAEA